LGQGTKGEEVMAKTKCVCYQCGKDFETFPAEIKKGGGRYCSRQCYYDAHKKVDCICKHCGNTFQEHPSTYHLYGGKYCSRECYNQSRPRKTKLVCKRCGKDFESYKKESKYCSRKCYHGYQKIEVICIICNKTFLAYPSAIKKGRKYCSKECYYKGIKLNWQNPEYKSKMVEIYTAVQNRPEMIGLHREQGYTRVQSEATIQLLSEMRKGENNPYYGKHHPPEVLEKMRGENNGAWKGGITTLYDAIRRCTQYDEWRMSVFRRDGFRDWFSGLKGDIRAHHIKSFFSIIEENNITTLEEARLCEALWDINNGVTMLETTHMAYHNMWGR
jgi:hypothetical protein